MKDETEDKYPLLCAYLSHMDKSELIDAMNIIHTFLLREFYLKDNSRDYKLVTEKNYVDGDIRYMILAKEGSFKDFKYVDQ